MILSEIVLAHSSLKKRKDDLEYFHEWRKLLTPISWRIFHMRNVDQRELKKGKKSLRTERVLRDNTESLKRIVLENGCITISKFGAIASHCAWLIVQHSDHDREFQMRYLQLMEENLSDVYQKDYEWLRMRVAG